MRCFHTWSAVAAAALTSVVATAIPVAAAPSSFTPTWTKVTPLPAGSLPSPAESFPDAAGGSFLFYVLGGKPTVAHVSGAGAIGTSVSVPAIPDLVSTGTPGTLALLSTGGAVFTWTLTTYGSSYMAYRSATGVWGAPVQLPSGFSNIAASSTEVLTSEGSSTGLSVESFSLSPTGAIKLASGPVNVYTGEPLFGQSWLALDAAGSAELVVFGSTDGGDTESVSTVSRTATGKWSKQAELSVSGQYVNAATFAGAPGGRAVVTWVVGQTAFAATSYAAMRVPGGGFTSILQTGSVSDSNGAYLLVKAAAGADGTLAVATTSRLYESNGVSYTTSTTVRKAAPSGTALGSAVAVPSMPESLGAGDGEAIAGTLLATYSAGNPSYPSSYTEAQQVVAVIVANSVTSHVLGNSSGLYDGNGSEGCPCPTGPPAASISGVAVSVAGDAAVVGQLEPGGVLSWSAYVAAAPPAAPASLKATAGVLKVTLQWTAPASDNGSAITGYNIYEGTSSGHESTKPVNSPPVSAKTLSDTVSGLKKGTKYYFVVKAINAAGVGASSKETSATPT